jgi:hypothetical protein
MPPGPEARYGVHFLSSGPGVTSSLSPLAPTLGCTSHHCEVSVAVKPQPMIAVEDVEATSAWYQRVLGLKSGHGGLEYEQLNRTGFRGGQLG